MIIGGLIIAYLHVPQVTRIHHASSCGFFTLDTSTHFSIFILFFLCAHFLSSLLTIVLFTFLCFLSCVLSRCLYSFYLCVSPNLRNHGHMIGFNQSSCKSTTLFHSASSPLEKMHHNCCCMQIMSMKWSVSTTSNTHSCLRFLLNVSDCPLSLGLMREW